MSAAEEPGQIQYEVMMNSQPAWDVELLESMNMPGGFALRLPVEPRMDSFIEQWGNIRFAGIIGEDHLADLVGVRVEPEPFYPENMSPHQHEQWNADKFAAFVLSHRHLRVPWLIEGQPAPTLAALAAYLLTPILVRYRLNGVQRLVFITSFGEITHAEFTGDDEAFSHVGGRFIGGTLNMGMQVPGVRVLPAPIDPHPFETVIKLRLDQFADWKRDRAGSRNHQTGGMSLNDLRAAPAAEVDFRRAVIASAAQAGRLYELIVPPVGELSPLDVKCAVDGVLQRFADPVTGEDKGFGAWVSDWADWILRDSARGTITAAGQPWEAAGMEADMYRLEHNIVSYSEEETEVSRFFSADELQAWVDRSLGNHNAPLQVRLFDSLMFAIRGDFPAYQLVEFNRAQAPEPAVKEAARKFNPWDGMANWAGTNGGHSRHPVLSITMDGQQIETFSAANCLDDDWLNNDMLPAGTPATENAWYLLRLEGTATAMTFPARGTMLTVATDNDGASSMIVAREANERQREIDQDNAFDLQWSRWLHDDRPLSPEEIRAGLETLDHLIKEARA